MDRRRFLKTGASLAAGLWAGAGTAQDAKAAPRRAKSVIWLWMEGAPSQFETWDPKPDLAAAGGVKVLPTTVEGLRISERLPLCAKEMHRMSLLRTVTHPGTTPEESAYLMHCGLFPSCWDVDVPVGSILAYELWRRESGAPPFLAIGVPSLPESAVLGDLFVPVHLRGPSPELRRREGKARWALLAAQDQAWAAAVPQTAVREHAQARAISEDWMNSSMMEAMDLSLEPADLVASYGPGFGRNCLLARRLVQAGTAVVEVGLGDWNTPKDGDSRGLCAQLDTGLATLVRDLAEKDLLKDTVVFCAAASGRSPDRAPWMKGFSVVMAGGNLAGGRVFGSTGPDGRSAAPAVPLHNLFATLLHACGVDSNKKYETMGRKNKYVSQGGSVSTSGTPIKELF